MVKNGEGATFDMASRKPNPGEHVFFLIHKVAGLTELRCHWQRQLLREEARKVGAITMVLLLLFTSLDWTWRHSVRELTAPLRPTSLGSYRATANSVTLEVKTSNLQCLLVGQSRGFLFSKLDRGFGLHSAFF
jgi:hypothetical protein